LHLLARSAAGEPKLGLSSDVLAQPDVPNHAIVTARDYSLADPIRLVDEDRQAAKQALERVLGCKRYCKSGRSLRASF
jgi:hypothetical protein